MFGISWKSYDVDELDFLLLVSEKALESGRVGLPESIQVPPDAVEEQIRLEITSRVTTNRQEVAQRVDALDVAVGANQINSIRGKMAVSEAQRAADEKRHREALGGAHKTELEDLEPAHREKLAALDFEQEEFVDSRETEIAKLERKLPDYRKEIERYQQKYGIEREPQIVPGHERTNGILIIAGLATLQAISNAFVLKDIVVEGLLFAILVAGLIGGVDVVTHFKLGQYGSALKAPDFLARIRGVFCFLGFFTTLPLLNLSVVHLRLIAVNYPGEEFGPWYGSITEDTFGFIADPIAVLLLLLGCGCSFAAFASGFKWDEYIPCFLNNQRRIDKIEGELDDIRYELNETTAEYRQSKSELVQEQSSEREAVVARQADEMSRAEELFADKQIRHFEGQLAEAQALIRDMDSDLRHIEQLEDRLSAAEHMANTAFVSLVQRYRNSNREGRRASDISVGEPPGYFNTHPSLDLPEREDSIDKVREKVGESQRQYRDIQEIVARHSDAMAGVLSDLRERRIVAFMDPNEDEGDGVSEQVPEDHPEEAPPPGDGLYSRDELDR